MNAELRLPPSARDFQIFRDVQFLGCSTWREAQVFKISQTRVRQIVCRVGQWVAENLPAQTDLEREKEVRLAQHLAAERLQEMFSENMNHWREKHEPKYMRHAMRAATAMGRMGVVAGKLDEMLDREELEETGYGYPEEAGGGMTNDQAPMTKEQPEMTNEQVPMTNEGSGQLKAESGERKAEPEAESGEPKAEIASTPPFRDFSRNSAQRDVQQRRQQFLRGGNTTAVEGYVLSPRITEPEDIEVIRNWVELLKAAEVRRKAESGEAVTEVRVGPEEPVTVT